MSGRSWLIDDMWRNRGLLWQFTRRNIQVRHRGSYLGVLWLILTPLLMLGLYSFTFGLLLKGRFGVLPDETSADYSLGIFLGFTLYGLVADTMGASPFIVISNSNLVKKVVFPIQVLPAASTLAAVYSFLISLALFMIGLLFFGPPVGWSLLWLPVIVFPMVLLSLGLAWLLSALGVFFRDIQNIIMFISTALFYASGIFYSARGVREASPEAWSILKWNPIFQAIELSRDALLWRMPVDLPSLTYLYISGALVCILGYAVFQKLKGGFADVL